MNRSAYIIYESKLRSNLQLLQKTRDEAGVEIIMALKAFAFWPAFPLIKEHLDGAAASSLNEARLIYEEMRCKGHAYSPAFLPFEIEQIIQYSNKITFNSINEYEKYRHLLGACSPGLRVNTEHSSVDIELYNPAAPSSRLGITSDHLGGTLPEGIEGLHFHTLCESDSYALEKNLEALQNKFDAQLKKIKWLNLGGGHLITASKFDTNHLIQIIWSFKNKYPHIQIIMEPGAAIAWNIGVLEAHVLDIVVNGGVKTAILDVSFTAHMPDTLEMPYQPEIPGAKITSKGKNLYRLGGMSCLAGDFIGYYDFDHELEVGEKLILEDMAHYTMVKTTMFNGVTHPDIILEKEDGTRELIRRFGYEDYKNRMA